MLSSKMKI